MVRRNLCLYHVALIVLFCLSQTDAGRVAKTAHIPIISRQRVPPICRPASLEPAVDCGCFLYAPLYSPLPRWQFLEDLCLEELSGNIDSGERRCSASPYGNGVGSNLQGNDLALIQNRASLFFRDAKKQCSRFDPATVLTNSQIGLPTGPSASGGSSSGPSITFADITGRSFASRTGARLPSNERTSIAGSSRYDVHSGLPGQAVLLESKTSLETGTVIRKGIKCGSTKRLKDFCHIFLFSKGLEKPVRRSLCG